MWGRGQGRHGGERAAEGSSVAASQIEASDFTTSAAGMRRREGEGGRKNHELCTELRSLCQGELQTQGLRLRRDGDNRNITKY